MKRSKKEYIDLIQERLPQADERALRLIYIFIDEMVPTDRF